MGRGYISVRTLIDRYKGASEIQKVYIRWHIITSVNRSTIISELDYYDNNIYLIGISDEQIVYWTVVNQKFNMIVNVVLNKFLSGLK